MKTRSKKNKGVRLQNFVVERLKEVFGFNDLDIRPAIMGESGADVKVSSEAIKEFPFSIECKNQERWNIVQFFNQAIDNTLPDTYPLLVVKKNRQEPLVVLRFGDFLDYIARLKNESGRNNKSRGARNE